MGHLTAKYASIDRRSEAGTGQAVHAPAAQCRAAKKKRPARVGRQKVGPQGRCEPCRPRLGARAAVRLSDKSCAPAVFVVCWRQGEETPPTRASCKPTS